MISLSFYEIIALVNFQLKSYFGRRYLSTTAFTTFMESKTSITEQLIHLDETKTVELPVTCIENFDQRYYCIKCNRVALQFKSIFIKCETCGAKSLLSTAAPKFTVKVSIDDVVLNFSNAALKALEDIFAVKIDTDQFQEMMLSRNDVILTYNVRNMVVISCSPKQGN